MGTALHHLIRGSFIDIASLNLLLDQCNLDLIDSDGRTPLHIAINMSCMDVIQMLLFRNANINIQDKLGLTPLHLALSVSQYCNYHSN